ncbi:hypothetical protein AB0H83_37550 [Dactylosporangium sp. NPDC050688]|uniref:hypothetical protein n=1 Tax=Dactylosporangium sp. NPDC050688 TaxID=3157217 RepID=UPI0033DBB146
MSKVELLQYFGQKPGLRGWEMATLLHGRSAVLDGEFVTLDPATAAPVSPGCNGVCTSRFHDRCCWHRSGALPGDVGAGGRYGGWP